MTRQKAPVCKFSKCLPKPTHKFTTLKLLKHIKDFFKITYFLPILNCDYKQPNNLMTCYLK